MSVLDTPEGKRVHALMLWTIFGQEPGDDPRLDESVADAVSALLSPRPCPECRGGGRVLVRPFPGSSWDDGFGPCRACTSTGSLPPLLVLRTEHDAKVGFTGRGHAQR